MKGLISVIIPVFNVEKYLKECVESILNQTYKKVEIIAVNDGSTDDSLKILESIKNEHPNIRVYTQENSGQSVARNKGIEKAKGEFIYFLDADDYIVPDTFQYLINIIQNTNIDLIRFSAKSFTDDIKMEVDQNRYNFDRYFDEKKKYQKDEFLKVSTKAYSPSPVLYFMRRELLTSNKLKFKPGIIHEDDLFTTELFLNVNNAMYLPKTFYRRRYRKGSTMTTTSILHKEKSYRSRCVILKGYNTLLKKYKKSNEVKFIKRRRTNTIEFLVRNYPELTKTYKIKEIKKVKVPLLIYNYYYRYLRRQIIKVLRVKRKKSN